MGYTITLISTEERERLMEEHLPKVRYEIKSDLYGCCIKLMTDDHATKDTWGDNFYSISQNIRSHGRLLVFKNDGYAPDTVLFDPLSRTAFLFNFTYYGWIKSIALSLAGDILEDHHGIFSVHGACVDIGGKGLCIIGAPKGREDNADLRPVAGPAYPDRCRRLVLLAGLRPGYPCLQFREELLYRGRPWHDLETVRRTCAGRCSSITTGGRSRISGG